MSNQSVGNENAGETIRYFTPDIDDPTYWAGYVRVLRELGPEENEDPDVTGPMFEVEYIERPGSRRHAFVEELS